MSELVETAPPPPFSLEPGLYKYYSSQAELMLAQYENINRLLGPTHDWTHPGDFCEILLRDLLRRFLPPSLSVDKGFFYGRASVDGQETHCPEIDILIHDTEQIRPLFRMGDFVIVQPQTVRGMIQVKRTLTKPQVRKGIGNLVNAKQHLVNVLRRTPETRKSHPAYLQLPQVFSAVIGFADKIGNDIEFYHNYLLDESRRCRIYDPKDDRETSMYVLPAFIGSLTSHFLFCVGAGNYRNQEYYSYQSLFEGDNVCIQAILFKLFQVLMARTHEMPPFAWPTGMSPLNKFSVLSFESPTVSTDGTVTLRRKDGWTATFRKTTPDTADQKAHFTADSSGEFKPTALLPDVISQYLFIERAGSVDRYEKITDSNTPPEVP